MGGIIKVESTVGKGTTVNFDIVVATPVAEEPNSIETFKTKGDGSDYIDQRVLNILIVEDDRNNAIMLEKVIERLNHKATTAHDGEAALISLKTNTYDLILMDIQMPRMDGFKATKTIRTDPEFKHVAKIPIVALTAHVLAGYRERCLEAGMDDYLSKPVKLGDLKKMIANYL
jgi:CheY-like chemotaxis protein